MTSHPLQAHTSMEKI